MPIPDIRKQTPKSTTRVSIVMEDDILAWFRNTGRGYQKRINDVLRWYIDEVEKQSEGDPNLPKT